MKTEEEKKEYMKLYYEKNKEKLLLQKKIYRENNKDKIYFKNKKYKENNLEKVNINSKQYRENNKEKLKLYQKEYTENNKNKSKEYYENNKEKISLRGKEYRENNKDKINQYYKKRRQCDPLYKLKQNLRTIIRTSIKKNGYKKLSKTELILGCSFEEFKNHLESKFQSWMTWDNQGKYNGELNYGWDVDHIIPVSSTKTQEEIIKLNHYTNLQPLCSKINRNIKKDKLDFII